MTFDPENWSPVTLGPTWHRGPDGKFLLPELTLGHECLQWTYQYLRGPKTEHWTYTKEQARFILWWYAIDERGRFLFEDSTFQRLKGHGKDPMIATLSAFEMLGPCRFDRFDPSAPGGVRGRQADEAWVQLAAVSKKQTRNTMKLFPRLFSDKAKVKYGLRGKIGRELILGLDGEAQIEAVTSSPETLEGGRPSFLVFNETQHWTKSNDGILMAQTGRDNATKVGGRVMTVTNAPVPGQESVAEHDRLAYEDHLSGKVYNPRYMYDSLEAPADAPLHPDVIEQIIEVIRGDSVWIDTERTRGKILDPRTPQSRARRMYYNQIVALEDALIAAAEWDPIANPELKLEQGDEIVLGADVGHSDDASALVAIRIRDRAIFPIKIWEKPQKAETWAVDMDDVDGMVANTFTNYKVRAFFSDVHPAESYVNGWANRYRETVLIKAAPGKSAVGFDMRGNQEAITRASEGLVGEIRAGTVSHTGDLALRRHVLNAIAKANNWGVTFGKEGRESPKKVDGYAAMVLAFIALNKYLESGKKPEPVKQRRGWFL